MSTSIELLCCLVLVCVSHVAGQLVSCRASASCSGGPGDDVGVAVDGRGCCVDNPRALAYADGEGSCVPCVVVGFLNTTFSGVEQGPGHSVPVGYRKGSGTNLVFDVGSTPGTAREGPQYDYTANTVRVRALANGRPDNVVVTFRVDTIAQESNETFTLTLTPLNAPPPREGLFFQNSVNVTIIDSDNVEFSFTEDDYRASEPSVGGSPSFLPVIVSKSTRIASRVELVVTPLTVLEAIATFLPLPPNIPNDDPRSPPFANLHDFNNTNITIIFEPDEDAEVSEMSVPIFVFDDAINEATEQTFVIELQLISSLDPASVDLSVRPSSLCRIIDNDPIHIGFELPGYTYTEPIFNVVVDQFFLSLTGRPENGPIYLIKEDNVISEQTFLVSIRVTDSAPSGTSIQPATIDQDYGFGAVGQTSETVLFSAFEQRILVPFNLFGDNLPEGTEAFQASVSPEDTRKLRLPNGTIIVVERFPTPLDPVGLASEIFVIIEDNDRNDTVSSPAGFLPFGSAHGDTRVPTNDDGSTSEIRLGTDIVIFGSRQNRLYVNTNGVLSFGQSFTRASSGGVNYFNSVSSPPIIAPFWDDVDVRNGGTIYYRQDNTSSTAEQVQQNIYTQFPDVGFFYPSLVFVATWDRVEPFSSDLRGLVNTFQVVLASDGRRTFVRFSYGDIQWGGFRTLIGVSAGDRINFITHPASLIPSVASLIDNTTVTYRVENATTVLPTIMPPTTVPPTTTPPPFECFVEGQVLTYFNDTSDGRLSQFQGTFEICIGGFYGSVCDIGWNQAAAQTLCHSRFGSRYVAEPLYGLDFPSTRRFVAQRFNCSSTIGGLRSCRYDTGIDAQCNIGSHVAGVRCTESNDTIIPASFLPFGLAHGDSTVPRTDDGSTTEIRLGTDIVIFGSRQNRLYVNTNGVLSFGRPHTSTSSGGVDFNLILSSPPIIAPFWDDINIVRGGAIYYRQDNTSSIAEQVQQNIYTQFPDVGFFYPSLVFVATWDRVEPFSSAFRGLVNTFQVVIASDGRRTFVRFSYGDIQWGGSNTLIGVSAGDRANFITHPASLNSSVTSLLDHTTVTYRIENATTVLPTTPPPIECFVEGRVLTYFNDTSDRRLSQFQGTFEICIGGFYGSVCDIGWNQEAAQTLCHSQFGQRYVAEPLYGLGFPRRRFVAQHFNCSSTTGGLGSCSYDTVIDAQCHFGSHVAGVRCTESNDTVIIPAGFLPFGSAHGDSRVPRFDDGSTGEIQLGTDIVIFGSRQNRLYVNSNGVLSLERPFTDFSSNGFNFNDVSSPPIIAPFWDDINVIIGGTIYYRQDFSSSVAGQVQQEIYAQYPNVGFFYPSLVFVATWDRVAAFSSNFSGLANTFQVVIASDGGRTFVRFSYGDIQWGGFRTLIGVSAGDGSNFITHPASLSSSVLQLDSTSVTYQINEVRATPLPPSCLEFDLQLVNLTTTYTQGLYLVIEGNIEVCINGTYVAVCDLGWDHAEAQLACNAVGYTEPFYRGFAVNGLAATTSIGVENVVCPSNTTAVSDCSGEIPPQSPRCLSNFSAAGVRCIQERAQCFSDGDFSGLNITYESYLGLLVGADFSFTSRVVVCQNGIYGSVCDINWDQDDANILCNSIVTEQERYEATPLYGFDIGADPIVLESINCAGDEFNISSCPISPLGQITNSLCRESNRGAGVRCRLTPDSCFNGQGRLVDGPAFYEGRLEVCVDNQWHSVCEEDFDMAVATSVCRDRIRLTGNQGIAVYGNAYGSGSGPTLTACSSAGFTYFVPIGSCPFSNLTCSSEREVGVRCPRGQLDILAIPMGSGRVGSSSFSIQCFAQQFPWNTTLVSGGWYDADGNPVVASSNGGPVSVDVILNMYNSLPINLTYTFRNQLNFDHPLSISDGGYYNCNITVELHYPDGSTTKLSNSTVYPLIIEAPPPTSLTIISGDSPIHNRPYAAICLVDFETAVPLDVVTMEWRTVDGDPLIELSDRVSVSQIRRISDSIFARDVIVRPLRAEDSGTYICEVGITGRFVTNSSVNVSADIAVIVPPPAPKVQGLCSVVVWNSPEVSCEGISGYDVRLYSPQSVHRNVTRRVEANGTYYIIKDEDNLAGSDETYVQVRIIHNSREGEWSEGISLGCEKPTVPEMPRVYFMLQRKIYRNNSAIPLTEIGEGDNALHCKTDKEECCGTVPNRFGEFYYPNGVLVPVARRQHGFYRNRGDQVVRLNRRERATSPTGTYRCEIPNADDEVVKIYITLTGN